jgi:hypothetical protein
MKKTKPAEGANEVMTSSLSVLPSWGYARLEACTKQDMMLRMQELTS